MNCYYGWNLNKEILHNSTSGGIFSAIAETILKRGGVVFGASIYCKTSKVKHVQVDDIENLAVLRGAKYQQSMVGTAYFDADKALREDKEVLFSGTPCQIAGLVSFLKVKGTHTEGLTTVEVLCHGVTNTEVVKAYLSSMETNLGGEITDYSFRTKNKPWYHSGSSMRLKFSDGRELYRNHSTDEFYLAYGGNLVLRPSCYKCRFTKKEGRIADFTIGDFWGAEDYLKNKEWLNQGIGLILTNTEKGSQIFQRLVDEKVITATELEFEKAVPRNGALVQPAEINSHREDFFKRFQEEDFSGIVQSYFKKTIFKGKIKSIVGYDNLSLARKIKRKIRG